LLLVEVTEDLLIEFARALKARAERLLDDDANPALVLFREPRLAQLFDGLGVEFGRDREVEESVALRAALAVNGFEHLREVGVALWPIYVRRQKTHAACERLPDLLVNALRLGELDDGLLHLLAELFVGHGRAAQADDGELRRQQALLNETVE